MKLLKNSKQLIAFFIKNNCISHSHQTNKTTDIISDLYDEILEAYHYLLNIKKNRGEKFYNISIKKIESSSQIPKPKNFNYNSFPEKVRQYIDELSNSEITYTFSLFDRNIKLHFIEEESNVEQNIETYNKYVDSIIIWMYILNKFGSKKCSSIFTVYFYFTSLKKQLPKTNIDILDQIHVNTAFTTTCPNDSEIVVFRREEWFKVFIHETFHNFALDFSDMNNDECTKQILKIFPVKSEVNLYESYTEFWAEIINTLFCSFLSLKNKNNIDEFLESSEYFINLERAHSFFQLVKTLDFMGLEYTDLYSNSTHGNISRNTFYKEKTNVLSYYVIKTILINNYQQFLLWCKTNNFSLLQFKKTLTNQREFCNFIQKTYKNKSMLENVKSSNICLTHIKKNKKNEYLLNNMKMSICELG
jgi:hypothetical protein